jgi:superoxide dismutase, Fe-Mn family
MQKFEEKKFNIPKLKGISEKNIEEHLKLYAGYVTHSNLVLEKIAELGDKTEENMGLLSGLQRRFAFEFDGMRNHEYYFSSFEGGPKKLDEKSELKKGIMEEFGGFDKWLIRFKSIATTRGVGWTILYWDRQTQKLLNQWVDEHHLGQLASCSPILALDMWEHAFVADYQPSGKKNYIEDFFENLNWQVIEQNFKEASH